MGTVAAAGGSAAGAGGAAQDAGAGASGSGAGGTAAGGTGAAGSGVAGGGAAGSSGEGKVELAGGVIALFPAPGATALCPDPTLRLVFNGPPRLGSSGKIQIWKSQPASVAITIDLAAGRWSDTIGGTSFNLTRPVEIDGDAIVARLPVKGLEYGQRYHITVERGAITGPGGAVEIAAGAWEFETRAAAPAERGELTVAADGSGDFCTVQPAIDLLAADSSSRRVIEIAPGTYRGVIHFSGKHNLTIRGMDRKGTVLRGTNNENLNPGTAKRALIGIDDSRDLIIENLTIHNETAQGGGQAEALRMQKCERCSVRDADIRSLQDTLLWSGRVYARNCYIEGNVDYIWGTGAAFFDRCEIKTVGRSGYNVQARNGAGAYGYVFVNSRLTSSAGVTGVTLARIDSSVYPASHVAYIDCELGDHVSPAGWVVTGGSTGSLRFWEFGSIKPGGAPVDVSRRLAGSKQISAAEAERMRDPSVVLGGWQPPP
jgi:pectin methylesterase-like acyl-CoA thioesterase